MRDNIATALGLEMTAVSVKATTHEGLGALGAEEGAAAHAVCTIADD
jgi:2-C-methyl-D-erythritol 2,4-cyclodiphosphate synthase